jgi:large subunit ribosomal protein L25
MGLVNLNIHPRTTSGKNENRRSRAAGRLPAVLYGKGRPTENIELDAHEFNVAMIRLGGRSSIFSLEQEGREDECIALLREVQRNPVTDEVLHVDLMEIPRGQDVTVPVAVEVVGTNNAVKTGEGSVVTSLNAIELSCRPSQLPEYIEIDISELELNDKIFVKDLEAPVGEFVTDPEALVLNIMPATIFVEPEEEAEGEEAAEGEAAEGEAAEGEGDAKADGDEEKKDD